MVELSEIKVLSWATSRKNFHLWSILAIVLFISCSAAAQKPPKLSNRQIDSMNLKDDPFYAENSHFQNSHYHRLLRNSISNQHTKGIVDSYFNLGLYYSLREVLPDSMIHYYDQAILLIEKTGVEKKKLSEVYTAKANFIENVGLKFLMFEPTEKAYGAALEDGDKYAIMRAQVNLASANVSLGDYENAMELAREMLKDPSLTVDSLIYDLNTKNDNLADYLRLVLNGIMANGLLETGKSKSAFSFIEIADSLALINDWKGLQYKNNILTAKAHLGSGNPKETIDFIESLIEEFPEVYEGNLELQILTGKALLQSGQISKSIAVMEEGLQYEGPTETKVILLENLVNAYLSLGNTSKSQLLFSKVIRLRDSIQIVKDKYFSRYSSTSYDLLDTQYKNDNLVHKNEILEAKAQQREYVMGLLALSIVVILMTILGYLLWKKYSKGEKTIKTLKVNEKSMLEAHIKVREDELNATRVHLSKSIATLDDIIAAFQNGLAKKDLIALRQTKNALRAHREASSATSLLTDRIESQYPGISAQLMHLYPNFTANDIKHCLMIKLGLSLKETAQLFNITVAAVKSARGRMRKKMGLGQEVSLKKFFSDLTVPAA